MSDRYLIVAGVFYRDIADALVKGAREALEAAGAQVDIAELPGALELPGAIVQAESGETPYDGYVALGCVIRGETPHFDYVCAESARGLMDLTLAGLAVGNGVLTVNSSGQAKVRAVEKKKGADAAEAARALVALRNRFGAEA